MSLEAEPGEEFLKRLESLDRITNARLRIVRPNPGWKDLEAELGQMADDSDAHKAEVVARARRGSSLEKEKVSSVLYAIYFDRKNWIMQRWKEGEKANRINSTLSTLGSISI